MPPTPRPRTRPPPPLPPRQLYSPAGRRLGGAIKLGAGLAQLACNADWLLLALTTTGRVKLVHVGEQRTLLSTSVAPLVEDGAQGALSGRRPRELKAKGVGEWGEAWGSMQVGRGACTPAASSAHAFLKQLAGRRVGSNNQLGASLAARSSAKGRFPFTDLPRVLKTWSQPGSWQFSQPGWQPTSQPVTYSEPALLPYPTPPALPCPARTQWWRRGCRARAGPCWR